MGSSNLRYTMQPALSTQHGNRTRRQKLLGGTVWPLGEQTSDRAWSVSGKKASWPKGGVWSVDEAADFGWALLSLHMYEYLVVERGWPIDQFVGRLQTVLRGILASEPGDAER